MSISIVIPAYNESKNLPILISEIYKYLDNKLIFEILIIDDCSTDNTTEIINNLLPGNIFLIKNKQNLGQSFSIIKGIEKAKNKTIVTIDADLQNNPKDILNLYKKYINNVDLKLVGGIRVKRKDNLIKIFSSKISNKIRMFILNDNCIDTGCSLKIFDKNIFLNFPKFNGIHRFLPALFKGYGYSTAFIKVDHRYRIHGKSKYGTIERLFRGIRDIIRVRKIINNYKKK